MRRVKAKRWRAALLLWLVLSSMLSCFAQEPWPVPLTRQKEGVLYFEAGAFPGPRTLTWIEIPNQSKHPLYVAMGRELLYNILVDPAVASVDEKGAMTMLTESNPKVKVVKLATHQRKTPFPGVVLDYRLGKNELGALFLGKDKSGQVVAVMAEGARFDRSEFLQALDGFKPGATPPPEWKSRAPHATLLVKDGVAMLKPLYFRVPHGFNWQESADGDATVLLGIRKKPFALLAARVAPVTGRALDDRGAVEGSESLLKAMVTAHTGIGFRIDQRMKLDAPFPNSWVLTAKGQTLAGGGLPARIFLGFGEGFQVALVAVGADDSANLSSMHNSLSQKALAPLAPAPKTETASASAGVDQLDSSSFPHQVVADTLVYVSLILCFSSLVVITAGAALRNKMASANPLNPFSVGLKASTAICLMEVVVALGLLHSEGATPEDYQTYLLMAGPGMAVFLIPAALLARRWSRSRP